MIWRFASNIIFIATILFPTESVWTDRAFLSYWEIRKKAWKKVVHLIPMIIIDDDIVAGSDGNTIK